MKLYVCIIESYTDLRTIVSAGVLAVLLLACAGIAAGETWVVDDDGGVDFTSIQDAVNASSDGDTIEVRSGTYAENVNVYKRLTLIGDGADVVTVRAGDASDHVFEVTADYVNISGFTVTGATGWSKAGIYLYGADHCNISDTNASGNGNGILLYNSSNNTLTLNNASNNRIGIALIDYSSNNRLMNNSANPNNEWGISLWDLCNNNTLTNNNASSNNYAGIELYNSINNTLTNNDASDEEFGIVFFSSKYNLLANNKANSNNYTGIFYNSSDNNVLANNTANSNGCGIVLEDNSSDNTLMSNTANSNSNHGISLYSSSNNTLTNNTVSDNTWDLYIENSESAFSNNTLNGTTISFTYAGDVSLKGVGSLASDPAGWNTIGKFISATNQSAGAWIFLNFSYSGSDLSGLDESSLKVWKHNGTNWIEDGWNKTRYLDTGDDVVGVNITTFSVFAPAALAAAPPEINCTCGNICVNQTGWWRDGGVFNASGTPIQAAIDSATDGDTICVWNGSYSENVNVDKRLTLRGESADVVTVRAEDASDHVFEVTADYVNISGFTATGATDWQKAGIYLYGAEYCNISDNNASNNDDGIYLNSSINNTLVNNNASDNVYGIYLSFSSNNTLSSNNASDNGDGIHLYSSSDNTLTNNNANSNYDYGVYLYNSSENTLTSNTANSNKYGEGEGHGISLVASSDNNTLANNNASGNGYGISLSFSSNNTLTGNNANSNSGYYGTGTGIYLYSSSNNALTSNNANSNYGYNGYGILLQDSNDNKITNNTASNNGDGIYLYSSSNNIIYNNYFNNTNNTYDDGNNIWNITKTSGTNIIGGSYLGGNYWSDYAGKDTDGDGLGDTLVPYNSSDGIQNGGDWLPLVYPPAQPTTIYVNMTGWWREDEAFNQSNTPIRHAIYNATAGDTIIVKDGTYNESVDANKRLTIQSANGLASTIVHAANSSIPVFEVTADYVNISGFTVKGATWNAGIYLGSNHCNLSGNTITNNSEGVRLALNASGNVINSNNIAGNPRYGIYKSVNEVVNAENNWWDDVSGPSGEGYGTGDAISDYVDHDPWLDSPYPEGKPIYFTNVKEATVNGTAEIDARDVADTNVTISTTAPVNVTIGNYSMNPGAVFEGDIGKYIDVHVNDTTNVSWIEIKLYYTDDEIKDLYEDTLKMYWLNDSVWRNCSYSGVTTTGVGNYSGYVWANISKYTTPDLSVFDGLPLTAGGRKRPLPLAQRSRSAGIYLSPTPTPTLAPSPLVTPTPGPSPTPTPAPSPLATPTPGPSPTQTSSFPTNPLSAVPSEIIAAILASVILIAAVYFVLRRKAK